MKKIVIGAIAIVLILAGLVVLPLPIPFGAIMIVTGIVLLVSVSATTALWVRSFRRRNGEANKMIQTVEDRLPLVWRKILRRTDP